VSWQEIEILADPRGRPQLSLSGEAARLADELGLTQWDVSLTHTKEHASAVVVAM
jgi:holo-[acyl-carrier protein] synthase